MRSLSPRLQVVSHDSAAAFLEVARPWLMAEEAVNGLVIGIANALNEGRNFGPSAPLLLTVHREGQGVGAAVQTPPWYLLLSRMDEVAGDALVEWLLARGEALPGITGEVEVARHLAARLAAGAGKAARVDTQMRLFELREVVAPRDAPGRMRVARAEDRGLVAAWYDAFHDEVMHAAPARMSADPQLAAGRIYLWVDAQARVVSLATRNRETPGGASIGPVYTPPESRRRGYASALVARLSQAILDDGKQYVSLFTDLSNPVSNAIYPRVGYRPIAEMTMWALD